MTARLRGRFWFELGLSALCGVLSVLTIFVPAWIEAVFRVDPDQHSGALEWGIVVVLLVATVAFSLLARREWRRPAFGVSMDR